MLFLQGLPQNSILPYKVTTENTVKTQHKKKKGVRRHSQQNNVATRVIWRSKYSYIFYRWQDQSESKWALFFTYLNPIKQLKG